MREGVSPSPSPLLHRAMPNIRAVPKSRDAVDGLSRSTPPTSPQLGKLIIRAARSPDRAASPDYVRTPATVVGPTSPTSPHRQVRGAYVNVQGDEGKTTSTSGTSADEQRDCTGRTSRLEAAPRTSAIAPRSKEESKTRTLRSRVHDENQPPQLNGDACTTNVRAIVPSAAPNRVVSLNNPANMRMDLDKSTSLCPKILRVTGNTPKLGRKLLVSDLDTPNFCRRSLEPAPSDNRNTVEESATSILLNDRDSGDKSSGIDRAELSATCPDNQIGRRSDCPSQACERVERTDRKVKRSESYRMANSPIMFIKKFSNNAEKSSKICRTPSEELQEELLKERINYPETVSSPEPQVDGNVGFDMKLTSPIQSGPTSPRPRALDLEPARVLKYSSNDTEIW